MFDDAAGTDPMPMGVAVFLGILLISVGVLVFEVGRRSRSGTLARNWYVGIRTRATLASDENWEAAHRAGGGLLMIAAAGPVVGGAIVLLDPSNVVGVTVILVGLGWLVGFVIAAGIQGQKATDGVDQT